MEEKENKQPEEINEAQEDVQQQPESEIHISEELEKVEEKEVPEVAPKASDGADVQASSEEDKPTDDDSEDEESNEESEDEKILASLHLDNATKEDLLEALRNVAPMQEMRTLDKALKEIGPAFDSLYNGAREAALKIFTADENASAEDFVFKGDEIDHAFQELFEKLRQKKQKFFSELERSKDENLKRKNDLLEKLRELVDGEESSTSINAMKGLQEEWKGIGHVPSNQVKTLWANYNALMDRFYDNRSIYFELKELDRRKNLEAKTELCERAEALANLENLKDATVQLNELHEEYKHVGPVPKLDQEPLWQRFKTASDAIYSKRKEFYEELKSELSENATKKRALAEEVQALTEFTSEKISDWNKKTKHLQELQKKWDAIGGLPRDQAKAINKTFWGGFKKFFANKNTFFKSLDSQREENLKKKEVLLEKALELKESEDWEKTANDFKRLQNDWREIGPVPDKVRNEVYKKFKKACDEFFDRKRANGSVQEKEYQENLVKKQQVCDALEAYLNSDTIELSEVYELFGKYAEIGFVPRNDVKKIQKRFDSINAQLLEMEDITDVQKVEIETQIELSKLKNSPSGGHKLHKMEGTIRRKIGDLENDIATWNRNLDFFAASKTADKLRAEFDEKIESAKAQAAELKKQLKLLREA